MKKLSLFFLVIFAFYGCEKDDICADETTPMLVIEFFDITNPTVLKNISSLKIKADGQTADFGTFSGVSKITIPLKITSNSTKYSFILNSSSTENMNEDFLEFNYSTQNIFVSRACGYKTIFELNSDITGAILTDKEPADGLWMQNVVKVTNAITTENETHIKISF
jgi:hypothetical protein